MVGAATIARCYGSTQIYMRVEHLLDYLGVRSMMDATYHTCADEKHYCPPPHKDCTVLDHEHLIILTSGVCDKGQETLAQITRAFNDVGTLYIQQVSSAVFS